MKKVAISMACVLSAACGTAHSAVIYVNHAAAGVNNGSSWSDAYVSLEDGLSSAAFGDEIWVASGTYYPVRQADRNDPTATTADPRDAVFWIPRGVQIYGGFSGAETAVDQRPAILNHSILSGDIGISGDDSDNSYSVVYYRAHHGGGYGVSDSDQTTLAHLDGFKIIDANADTATGAGIYAQAVVIGSAMYNTRLSIFNSVVSDNHSVGNGGGALLTGWAGDIENTEFSENHSDGHGGGAYLSQPAASDRFIKSSEFSNNSAGLNGGALARQKDPVKAEIFHRPLYIQNTKFTENSAGTHGGAVSFQTNGSQLAKLEIANCEFSENETNQNGGGVYLGHGTVINQGGPTLIIRGSVGNVHSSTFADNIAGDNGGGVFAGVANDPRADADMTVTNSILWGNSATMDIQANLIVSMNSSCIQGGGWSSVLGNISTDPLFYDSVAGDYSLQNGSSAADAGWAPLLPADIADLDGDTDVSESLPVDLRGRPRSVDAGVNDFGVGPAPVTDMGAYELCTGDFNRDGWLDFLDLSAFVAAYTAGEADADINGDGILNFFDVSAFQASYSKGC